MKKNENILVIRFSSLGDIVILVPLLRVLFKTYPNLNITIATNKKLRPVFFEFKRLKFFNVDFNKTHKGLIGLWRLFNELKVLNISCIADLHAVIRSYIIGGFFKLSFFKLKRINKGRIVKKALIRKKNKVFRPLISTLYRYSDVFGKLGYPIDFVNHEFPDKLSMPEKLIGKYDKKEKLFVGIAPFAAHIGKIYPLDLMQKVVGYLEKNYKIFLFGFGKEQTSKLNLWENAFSNVYNCSDRLNLLDQIKLISNLNLMISMDSFNGHLAANAGIPVITIWGMTHPFLGFSPFLQPDLNQIVIDRNKFNLIPTSVYGNKIPKGYENAFRTISPLTILERANKILNTIHHQNQ